MLYSHWPSSDRYCKTLESSKWSVAMLTWRRTTWLNTHGKLTRFLQKMSHVCPTRKNQRLEEVIKWLIINGPYRIRYKHITNWFYLTMQVTKITHTPKCTPIYFSVGENWLFIVQFGAHGTFSHVGNIHRYKITPKFMCGKISLYTCKMCWFGWFSCLKT